MKPIKRLAKETASRVKRRVQIKWTPEMSVRDKTLDNQHQRILESVNELVVLMPPYDGSNEMLSQIRKITHSLYTNMDEHFTYEEGYMRGYHYPGLKEHKKIHHSFIGFYRQLMKEFNQVLYAKSKSGIALNKELDYLVQKCKTYLGQWLVGHFLIEDHKYSDYIIKHRKGRISAGKLKKTESKDKIPEKKNQKKEWVQTGIPGFDDLMEKGIPRGASVLIAGGPGSGKTIFCLQTLANAAKNGERCLYLSFEESEQQLKRHMDDFEWDWKKLENKGLLKIVRKEPFVLTTNIEAMLAKAKGELLIDINEVLEIIPKGFIPDRIVLDSITSISSAFGKQEEGYRIFIEQLFKYMESLQITSFLVSETEQLPSVYSQSGAEEFLADSVVVLYSVRRGNLRENAIEIIKMRGAKHKKKIVAMQITDKGIEVYPEQEVFGEIKE